MPTVLTNQYWFNAPKMQFNVDGGSPYQMIHNPTTYGNLSSSSAEIEIPASVGLGALLGGVEYAPVNIGIEWTEMDSSEYDYLSSISLLPCTMIDMEDNGFYGYLKVGSFDYIVGAATKTGSCKAIFMAIAPADGSTSVINRLNAPSVGNITTLVHSGGAIGGTRDITIQYGLSFWTNWGESLVTPFNVTVPGHTPAPTDYIKMSWNTPSTQFFRRARLYISTDNSGPLAPGDTAYLLGDVFWAQTQQWTDYVGNENGAALFNKVIVPSASTAYKGNFGGGRWVNQS